MNASFKYFTLITLLCFGAALPAQNVLVTVIEFGSNKPIEGVYVVTSDGEMAATTDVNGQAAFTDLEKPFELIVQHPSYDNITVTDKELTSLYEHVYLSKTETNLPTYTIRANRLREAYDEVSNDVDIIKPKTVQLQQPANSGELLTSSPKVYLQKSQLGGGSPVLRGLEASRVLLVVDGVRLNNAIYRSGHLQNVLTIDHDIVDQVEVVLGPGSLVYGSDALGGVMHFHTRDPKFGLQNELLWKVNASSRFASAYNGFDNHVDLAVGSDRIAYLASFSSHRYGDLRIGTRRSHGDPVWGSRPQYIERIDGEDVVVDSDDPNVLRFTGFDQYDLLQKLRVRVGEDQEWYTNFQYSTSTDVPRYDRLNDLDNDGIPRFAEWSYGPQRRLLLSSGYRNEKPSLIHNEFNIGASYQQIEESRLTRRRDSNFRNERVEDLDIYIVNADALKKFNAKHTLQYGLEYSYNDLTSTAVERDIESETVTNPIQTRYPDGENYMTAFGFYLRHKIKLNEQTILTGGARLTRNKLRSTFIDDTFAVLPFDEISYDNWGANWNIGLNYRLNEKHLFTSSIGSGYRNPNIDDVGKTFDFEPGRVVIPSGNVRPEYAYSFDVTYNYSLPEKLDVEVSAYYTFLDNLIQRTLAGLSTDSIIYEGELNQAWRNETDAAARIFGGTVFADWQFKPSFGLTGQLTFTNGQTIAFEDRPLGHIPPTFGKLRAYYDNDKWLFALAAEWNAEKPIDQFSDGGEDRAVEALPSGSPTWTIFNFNSRYQVNETWRITAAVENILDEHYIPFSSGISGAGRNFKLGVAVSF